MVPNNPSASYLIHIGQVHDNIEIEPPNEEDKFVFFSQSRIYELLTKIYAHWRFSCIYKEGVTYNDNFSENPYSLYLQIQSFFDSLSLDKTGKVDSVDLERVLRWLKENHPLFKRVEFYHNFFDKYSILMDYLISIEGDLPKDAAADFTEV